jgi:hypothetical protein
MLRAFLVCAFYLSHSSRTALFYLPDDTKRNSEFKARNLFLSAQSDSTFSTEAVLCLQDLVVTLTEAVAVIAISIITITECKSSVLSNTVLGVSENHTLYVTEFVI